MAQLVTDDERLKKEEERIARTMSGGQKPGSRVAAAPKIQAKVETPVAPVLHAPPPAPVELSERERQRDAERRQTEDLEHRNRERREAEQKEWHKLADERDVFYAGKLDDAAVLNHNAEVTRRNKEREAAAAQEEAAAAVSASRKKEQDEMRARMQQMAAAAKQFAPN